MIKENEEITFINTPLGARKSFSNAASAGLGVTEVKPLDIKAADQIKVLYEYVFNTKMKSVFKGEQKDADCQKAKVKTTGFRKSHLRRYCKGGNVSTKKTLKVKQSKL